MGAFRVLDIPIGIKSSVLPRQRTQVLCSQLASSCTSERAWAPANQSSRKIVTKAGLSASDSSLPSMAFSRSARDSNHISLLLLNGGANTSPNISAATPPPIGIPERAPFAIACSTSPAVFAGSADSFFFLHALGPTGYDIPNRFFISSESVWSSSKTHSPAGKSCRKLNRPSKMDQSNDFRRKTGRFVGLGKLGELWKSRSRP
jgi:hypothetical protein